MRAPTGAYSAEGGTAADEAGPSRSTHRQAKAAERRAVGGGKPKASRPRRPLNGSLPAAFDRPSRAAKAATKAAGKAKTLADAEGKPKPRKPKTTLNASLKEESGPLPPCPGAAQTTRLKLKTQARQRMCEHPAVHRSMRASAVLPLIWSRPLAETSRVFLNENPFETRKFAPFLAQLPPSSDASALLRARADTCAVVGASGSLLHKGHGALIDAHSIVLRPNWILTKGFEADVGTRTDANAFFGIEGMIDQFDKEQRKLPPFRRAIGLVTPASDRSVASFFRHMSRVRKNQTRPGRAGSASGPGIYLLADATYHRALGHICAATHGGCEWGEPGSRPMSKMRPSTGFFSVVVAMQLCGNVSLFGFQSDHCQPFHYYGPPKKECTAAIPKVNDETVHWFEREHAIYRSWAEKGMVTVYS